MLKGKWPHKKVVEWEKRVVFIYDEDLTQAATFSMNHPLQFMIKPTS